MNRQRGFAFTDLVMLVILFFVIGAVTIPIYKDLVLSAKKNNEQKVLLEVQEGLSAFFSDPALGNRKAFPAVLDMAHDGACSPANACFSLVLIRGGVTADWVRESSTVYRGPAGTRYLYQPAQGKFAPAE